MKPVARRVTRISLPDPIKKDEVKLELHWTADERTRIAIERQAKLMGFDDPTKFLVDLIANTLTDYEDLAASD